jgi:hypothetical protein
LGSVTLTIINSTLSGNTATSGSGGGINNYGGSSGNATVTITASTLSGNTAADGGGFYNYFGVLTIGDTILAGNTAGGVESNYDDNAGTLADGGYNLFGNDGELTGNGTTDILFTGNINTVLAPLANNGGPTQTMALVAGSPAIDAGDPALIGSPDQRGIVRGSVAAGTGAASDIGAYEYVAANNPVTPPSGQPGTPFFNFSAQFDANANYNTFFTQSWFPLFDAKFSGWFIPVFPPVNEPHPVYSSDTTSYAGSQTPGNVIGFGSSFTVYGSRYMVNGRGGMH